MKLQGEEFRIVEGVDAAGYQQSVPEHGLS
jgi:hypothetical protein